MFWYLFFGGFLLTLLVLLLAPLKLRLNSSKNEYYISFAWVLKVTACFLEDDIEVGFRLFGFGKNTTLLTQLASAKRKKSVPEKVVSSVAKTTKRKLPLKVIVQLLKTFRVKKFYINIDLGSVYYNAWLFPLGEIFKTQNVYCTTNFVGKTEIEIEIINRPSNILWAMIKTKLKSKTS